MTSTAHKIFRGEIPGPKDAWVNHGAFSGNIFNQIKALAAKGIILVKS